MDNTKNNFEEQKNIGTILRTDENDIVDIDFESKTPVTWWIDEIDEMIGKINYWEMVTFVWKPWSWKTEYCFFMARKNADAWVKTAFISLEMPRKNLILRTAIKRAGVWKKEWDNKILTENQKGIIRDEVKRLSDYNNLYLFWVDKESVEEWIKITPEDIGTVVYEWYEKWVKLFFIDNLWFIKQDWVEEWDVQQEACRILKQITNRLWITIVLIHHVKKWSDRDRLNMVRWSWKINDDSDIVAWLDRVYDDTTFWIEKSRMRWDKREIDIEFKKWNYQLLEEKEEEKSEKPF